MIDVFFGLCFDEAPLPYPTDNLGGQQYVGPIGLLRLLEAQLGLSCPPDNNEYLRIEQYRQALRNYLDGGANAFFYRSFEADQFATATTLLQFRDELLLAGWDFDASDGPARLVDLARIEQGIQQGEADFSLGFADRFHLVLQALEQRKVDINHCHVHEPSALLPQHLRRLFRLFQDKGIRVSAIPAPTIQGQTDLARLQAALAGQLTGTAPLQADGSLLILRAKFKSDLATYFAQLLRSNPSFRPSCLVPEKSTLLDHAVALEGMPSLGVLSASLARPTLQVLKLVTTFLWEPIDPYKIMEFVSLAAKPLEAELAHRIAQQMAQAPGLGSDGWNAMTARYFAELKERAAEDPSIDYEQVRFQYDFWFNRRRHPSSGTVPKQEAISIFAYLARWAVELFEQEGSKNQSLRVLAGQAKRVRELLEELPETQLPQLELERIVRTIYEPAPVQIRAQQLDSLSYTLSAGAVAGAVPQLAWWNFTENEPQHFFSRWYERERQWLADQGVLLDQPTDENARLIWHRKRPILWCQQQLLLLVPDFLDGKTANAHPLIGNIEALFGDVSTITWHIDSEEVPAAFKKEFQLPAYQPLSGQQLTKPKAFLTARGVQQLAIREAESISSLDTLLYYPYQWIFRHKLLLRQSSILSIVKENNLMGNLAHRLFEQLLAQEDVQNWSRSAVDEFIDQTKDQLFQQEGAVMLLYGMEPERVNFIHRVKYAAWSLLQHIQENGWKVVDTEVPLQGSFGNTTIKGRADLVLQRGDERAVVDLKWRGSRFRREMIQNEEDLQLVLYARLLEERHGWAHTAYFILDKAELLARNQGAFEDITPVSPDADIYDTNERILTKMEATYRWRMQQIQEGRIEIRCSHTEEMLAATYADEDMFELLEMKSGDAPFDDYRTLISILE